MPTKRKGKKQQSESQGTDFDDSLVENFDGSLLADDCNNEPGEDTLRSSQCDGVGEDESEEKIGNGKGAKKKKKGSGMEKKTKAVKEIACCTERDVIPRVPLPLKDNSARSFTALSWNVNGLRATVKNGLDVLRRMVETERPDLVCIQVKGVKMATKHWTRRGNQQLVYIFSCCKFQNFENGIYLLF